MLAKNMPGPVINNNKGRDCRVGNGLNQCKPGRHAPMSNDEEVANS